MAKASSLKRRSANDGAGSDVLEKIDEFAEAVEKLEKIGLEKEVAIQLAANMLKLDLPSSHH